MARLAAMFNVLEEADRIDSRHRRKLRKAARFADAALALSDDEFIKSYRLSKTLFVDLVGQLSPLLEKPSRRGDLPVKCKVLTALSFYATGSYQHLVGRNHGTVMSQPSVSRCITEVTEALNHESIQRAHIQFPATYQERNAIKTKFYAKYQISGVIGCVDGTHVAMVRPADHEERYFNRKHFHSRNVQIICDYDNTILNVDACFGGATHDSFIFNQHPIKRHLIDLNSQGEMACLLGDSGYAQRVYMMTPIINATTGSPEELYTKRQTSARNIVERTIGILKNRWRSLMQHRVLHYKPDKVAKIVNACVVLHNICNRARIPLPPDADEIWHMIAQEEVPNAAPQAAAAAGEELRRGLEARQRIVDALWNLRNIN